MNHGHRFTLTATGNWQCSSLDYGHLRENRLGSHWIHQGIWFYREFLCNTRTFAFLTTSPSFIDAASSIFSNGHQILLRFPMSQCPWFILHSTQRFFTPARFLMTHFKFFLYCVSMFDKIYNSGHSTKRFHKYTWAGEHWGTSAYSGWTKNELHHKSDSRWCSNVRVQLNSQPNHRTCFGWLGISWFSGYRQCHSSIPEDLWHGRPTV